MKNKVLEIMIKNGNNPKEAKQDIDNHYNDVIRIYGEDLSIKKTAELVKSFACL